MSNFHLELSQINVRGKAHVCGFFSFSKTATWPWGRAGGVAQEVISVGVKRFTCEADRSTHLVPKLRIRGTVPHFPYTFSCLAQEKFVLKMR